MLLGGIVDIKGGVVCKDFALFKARPYIDGVFILEGGRAWAAGSDQYYLQSFRAGAMSA